MLYISRVQAIFIIILSVLYFALQYLPYSMYNKYVDDSDDDCYTFLLRLLNLFFCAQCIVTLVFNLSFASFLPANQCDLDCTILVKTQMTNKVENGNDWNLVWLGQIF